MKNRWPYGLIKFNTLREDLSRTLKPHPAHAKRISESQSWAEYKTRTGPETVAESQDPLQLLFCLEWQALSKLTYP